MTGRATGRGRPWLGALALALGGLLLLSGCGKKGPPSRPEPATFPGFYPSPKTTLRKGTTEPPPAPAQVPETEDDLIDGKAEDETYFYDRTTTKTYSSE